MKTINLILFIFLFTSINAQEKKKDNSEEQETLVKFYMRDARENEDDITPQMLARKGYLCFYTIPESENLQLSNTSDIEDDQSYGPIYNITREVHLKTDKNLGSELIKFYWSYNNTYDAIVGTGEVTIFVIHKQQGDYFEITIIPENLDKLVYKGEMKGDLSKLERFIEPDKSIEN